jgi:hypothetical protein
VQHNVVIEEDFELERPEEVQLSIMTPRATKADKVGVMYLDPLARDGRSCALEFPGFDLKADVETIQLMDADLRASWGAQIYRILLESPTDLPNSQPVARGKRTYVFSAA